MAADVQADFLALVFAEEFYPFGVGGAFYGDGGGFQLGAFNAELVFIDYSTPGAVVAAKGGKSGDYGVFGVGFGAGGGGIGSRGRSGRGYG